MSSKSLLIGMVRLILAGFAGESACATTLELESHLQFEPAVVPALREGSEAARQRVGFAKKRRSDDAVDGTRVDVIQEVASLYREGQVVPLAGGGVAEHSAHGATAHHASSGGPATSTAVITSSASTSVAAALWSIA